jgi:hypothetical protein
MTKVALVLRGALLAALIGLAAVQVAGFVHFFREGRVFWAAICAATVPIIARDVGAVVRELVAVAARRTL